MIFLSILDIFIGLWQFFGYFDKFLLQIKYWRRLVTGDFSSFKLAT